jgi:hypothetical protein
VVFFVIDLGLESNASAKAAAVVAMMDKSAIIVESPKSRRFFYAKAD